MHAVKTDLEQPIVRRKLGDEVLDRLLKMIDDGKIRAGDPMPSERELMQGFGVGRPAVREAMHALESMGLIEIRHGERARLIGLTPRVLLDSIDRAARHLLRTCPQSLENLAEARLFFEVGMVRLAVKRGGEADLGRLAQALENLKSAKAHPKAFIEADMAFHSAIASFAGNPIYSALSEFLLVWLFEHYPRALFAPGAQDLTIAEHSVIYERIAAKDEEGAVAAMTEHLTRANPKYSQYVDAAPENRSGSL